MLLYLCGCTTGAAIPTNPTETGTPPPTPTSTVKLPARTPPATPEPTVTPTLSGVPGNIQAENVIVRCMDLAPELGKDAIVNGFPLLTPFGRPKPYLLNPKTMEIQELGGEEDGFVLIDVSPERDKFITMHVKKEQNGERYEFDSWVVMQNDGKILQTVPNRESWGGVKWLNEDQLIIELERYYTGTDDRIEPSAHLLLDPSSGGIKKLEPTFPFIYNWDPTPYRWGYRGLTVYDPALSRVVYAKLMKDTWAMAYVLWDLQTQQPILEIPTENIAPAPQWTPDGTKFIVRPLLEGRIELLVVTKDGVIEARMTLSDAIPGSNPYSYSWSPDGRSVAFWYNDTEDLVGSTERLAVWDTLSGKVSLLCVPGREKMAQSSPEPIWSPDGNYLLLENWSVESTNWVSLVDLSNGVWAKVAENTTMEGWIN